MLKQFMTCRMELCIGRKIKWKRKK